MGIPLRHLSVRHSDSTPTVGSRSHPGGIENILPPRDEPRSVEGPTSGRESAALGSRRRRRCDEWRDPSRRQRSRPTAASRRERHGCAPSRPSRHRRTTDPALSDVDRWHRSRTGCTRAPAVIATSRRAGPDRLRQGPRASRRLCKSSAEAPVALPGLHPVGDVLESDHPAPDHVDDQRSRSVVGEQGRSVDNRPWSTRDPQRAELDESLIEERGTPDGHPLN